MKKYLLALLVLVVSVSAHAFEPTIKPIEIVVPYAPGGSTDKVARIVNEMFTEQGWQSYVNNRAGADGVIAGNYVAKARSDGHTIFFSGTGLLDANIVFKTTGIEYNERSFVPVVPVANISYVFLSKDINSYEQFKSYVRTNPDRFNVGFWNSNTANIFYEWARLEQLPRPNIIIYKGSAPMLTDLMGGHINFAFDSWPAVAPHFNTGKFSVLAAMDRQGVDVVRVVNPNTKIVNISARHPDLAIGVWFGLWVPAGTPREVVAEINRVVNTALKQPKYQQALETMNIRRFGGSSEQLGQAQNNNFRIMQNLAK